ncbi:2-phosphoglycerate kinase [Acidiplasma aeolicum]|jgi:2-phosphoglycerate kinase|uniref:2-phosphoglycerate kinase n=2 Tax=Acidiplasma TaxID=507753 RepID=A0A0Q0VRC1_9ARCH|nr:mevalonate-3-phosphate 5-kinase [Acidiplasma aeolicum]KPV47323.1 2-phosphoglycerate kinase [Acidiplasma aeolicum]KQB36430.1 2-phosphoglycerate kinase [Acidiplasma aeolicum]
MFPVILIGGIPGVGKTSMAGYVAREFNINIVLSGDYLREFLRPYAGEILSKSVYESWQFFGEKTEDNIIKGYYEQSKIMYSGINAVLARAIRNGEPLILETLYYIPELIDKNIIDDIIKIYIYVSDHNVHEEMLNSREKFTHINSPGYRLVQQLPVYEVMEKYTLNLLKKYDVFTVDSTNYQLARKKIIKYIEDKINQ